MTIQSVESILSSEDLKAGVSITSCSTYFSTSNDLVTTTVIDDNNKNPQLNASSSSAISDSSSFLAGLDDDDDDAIVPVITPKPDPDAKNKKRYFIVKEIAETEASYLSALNVIVSDYLEPITRDKILTPTQISTIFSNVSSFPPLHQTILGRLNERISGWEPKSTCIGDIFMQLAPFLKLYSEYISNCDNANSLLQEIKDSGKGFNLFGSGSQFRAYRAFEKQILKKHMGMNLMSFLLTPVQRIPRYKLLLEDLLKQTDESHPDHKLLTKALEIISKTASFNNDRCKLQDTIPLLLNLEKNLKGHNFELVTASRTFIAESKLIPVKHKFRDHERRVILLNDMVIFANNNYLYKIHFKLDEIETVSKKDDLRLLVVIKPCYLEAWKTRGSQKRLNDQDRLISLLFESENERNSWLKRIEKAKTEWGQQLQAIRQRKFVMQVGSEDGSNYCPASEYAKSPSLSSVSSSYSTVSKMTGTVNHNKPANQTYSSTFASIRRAFSKNDGNKKQESRKCKTSDKNYMFQDEWRKVFFEFPFRNIIFEDDECENGSNNVTVSLWEYLRRFCQKTKMGNFDRTVIMFGATRQIYHRLNDTTKLDKMSKTEGCGKVERKFESDARLLVLLSDAIVICTPRYRYLVHVKLDEIDDIVASSKNPNLLELSLKSTSKLEAYKQQKAVSSLLKKSIAGGQKKSQQQKHSDSIKETLRSGRNVFLVFTSQTKRDEWYETLKQFRLEFVQNQ